MAPTLPRFFANPFAKWMRDACHSQHSADLISKVNVRKSKLTIYISSHFKILHSVDSLETTIDTLVGNTENQPMNEVYFTSSLLI